MLSESRFYSAGGSVNCGAWGYRSYREHLMSRFGVARIRKLCLQANFTCPNRDGTRGHGGCTYCDNEGFAPALNRTPDLRRQWDVGRIILRRRHRKIDGFIAYFQSFSNTYASVDRLRELYDLVPNDYPECVGLSLGTRPDCLPDPVVEYLDALGKRIFLTIEIGLQSDCDHILQSTNRGHTTACFFDAIRRVSGRSFELCVHIILGFPGEGDDAPERLGKLLARLPVQSVKIHNLHIMRGTALARQFHIGGLQVPSREWYVDAVLHLISQLRPDQAVQRLVADAPDRLLVAPAWCQDKQGLLADIAQKA